MKKLRRAATRSLRRSKLRQQFRGMLRLAAVSRWGSRGVCEREEYAGGGDCSSIDEMHGTDVGDKGETESYETSGGQFCDGGATRH